MASTLSPNMNLILPTVGQEPGPTYAFDVNSSLTLIDSHDHSPGRGVQITPAGLNINTDLSINSNSLTNVLTLVFGASGTASTTPMALSVAPGGESPQQEDLWYTPDTGVPIQITKNGQVNVVASSIPGESYAAGTFFWTQTQDGFPTTPANFDIGSVTIRPNVALTTFGVTLQPNSGISSQYSITLPLLPAAQSFLTIDASGNMVAAIPFANGITASNIANQTITATQIANQTITATQIANHTITLQQLATSVVQWNSHIVTANGTFTVPTDVNFLIMEGAGGGGGGGGGGGATAGAPGGGGGGGGGSPVIIQSVTAVSGDVLTIVIGAGGASGTGSSNSPGNTGGMGVASTVSGTGINLTFPGGGGGGGGNRTGNSPNQPTNSGYTFAVSSNGTDSGSDGAGGGAGSSLAVGPNGANAASATAASAGVNSSGGAGGGSGNATGGHGSSGGYSLYNAATPATGGAAGGNANAGGGGGGGSSFDLGGNGAAGSNTPSAASSAAANSGGGGGGGGGHGSNATGAGSAGGAGGSGKIVIYWLGNP